MEKLIELIKWCDTPKKVISIIVVGVLFFGGYLAYKNEQHIWMMIAGGNNNYEVRNSSIEGFGIFATKDFNKGEGPNNVNGMGVLEDILRGFTAYFSEEDNEGEYESSDVDKSLIGADSLILDKSSVGYTLTALVDILQSLDRGYIKNKIDIFKAGKAYFDDESPPMS